MIHEIENKFFTEFQHNGAAIMALEVMLHKYCGGGNGTVARNDYPDGVIAEIRERTESCEFWPWSGVNNICPLFDEIVGNLCSCATKDEKIRYAKSVLGKLQTWTCLYSLKPDVLDKIDAYGTGETVEPYFTKWRDAFNSFARRFAAELAMYGISIILVQQDCGIRIIETLDIEELWVYFGTREEATRYIRPLNIKCNSTMKFELDSGFKTERAQCLISRIVDKGYIKFDGNTYKWVETAALCGYFIDRSSQILGLRPSNGRIPWRRYNTLLSNLPQMLGSARQAVNDYQNKCLNKPDKYEVIEEIISSIDNFLQ